MKKSKKEKNQLQNPATTDAARAKPTVRSKWDIFFYAFVLLGCLYHWIGLNHAIITGSRSAHWPQTTGIVTDVRIAEHSKSNVNARPTVRPGGSGTTSYFYEVVPTYEYTVEGKQYVNNRVTTGGGWFYGGEVEAKQKAVSLRQATVVVYYDPGEPSKSVLERGVAERTSSGMLVTIPLAGIAAGMAFYQLSGRRMMERRRRLTLSIAAGSAMAVILALAQWFVMNVLV